MVSVEVAVWQTAACFRKKMIAHRNGAFLACISNPKAPMRVISESLGTLYAVAVELLM